MAYKGQDLDLRLTRGRPQRGPAAAEVPASASWLPVGTRGGHRESSITVDETVLAACNQAYEAAQFYGSREVQLEHLVFGLTRVPAAVDVLEEAGLRPERMRREAALALAADTVAPAADGKAPPAASNEFEAILRLAAERTGEATLGDLLRAILTGASQSPAATLLMRSATDPHVLERWRDETRREVAPAAEPSRALAVPDRSEDILARLDGLERIARSLAAEAASDRRSTQDLVRQAHGVLHEMAQADPQRVVAEGTADVKAALGHKLEELSDLLLALDERVVGVGKASTSGEQWAELYARIEGLEERLLGSGAEIARSLSPRLEESLSHLITQHLEAGGGASRLLEEVKQPWIDAGERLTALDSSVRAHLQGADEQGKTHERDLTEIYEALVKLGANQQTLANNLNTWRLDTSGDVSIVSNRLEALETTVLETLGRISAEVQMLRQDPSYSEDAPARRNGFKRWLYGTSSVLTTWRDEHGPIRQMLERARPEKKP